MLASKRQYTLLDRLLIQTNRCLQTMVSDVPAARAYPAVKVDEVDLSEGQRRQSAGFMRVNHCGEVCAQALYDSQAWFARDEAVRASLQQCAQEETDHLAWCQRRLRELSSRPSYLNVFWYTHSLLLGMIAGLVGDRWSLGFVEETEIQVGRHLQGHLDRIAGKDPRSEAIIAQMQQDEARHAQVAVDKGAASLPSVVKVLMRWHAKVMTTLAYFI